MSSENKTVGYTTGVFDMFHIGHLEILKKGKQKCDYLIVGVSTDELVESYKNRKPIIPYRDRFEIIKSIKYVDQVVTQSHRDKLEQFKEINYDILFVGDDWKGSDIFTRLENHLIRNNAKIVYFKYTKNVSSTKFRSILEDIYNSERSKP